MMSIDEIAVLLKVAGVTAGLAENNGSLPNPNPNPNLQTDCQEPGSAPEPYARQSNMVYLFYSR